MKFHVCYMSILDFILQGCSVSFFGDVKNQKASEVLELPDGTYKIFVSRASKVQVIKASKFMMRRTCMKNFNLPTYELLSENITQSGEVYSGQEKSSTIRVFGLTKTDKEYIPKHMFESEMQFKCDTVEKSKS